MLPMVAIDCVSNGEVQTASVIAAGTEGRAEHCVDRIPSERRNGPGDSRSPPIPLEMPSSLPAPQFGPLRVDSAWEESPPSRAFAQPSSKDGTRWALWCGHGSVPGFFAICPGDRWGSEGSGCSRSGNLVSAERLYAFTKWRPESLSRLGRGARASPRAGRLPCGR